MEWDDLRFVLAVARAGTLAGAARRLGVNQTTVARRLSAAEASLGTKLYQRADGALQPTKAGMAAIDRAARIEQDIETLARDASPVDGGPAGLVRVTAVPLLVNHLLVPEVRSLAAKSPRLRVELIAEARNLSLTRREADVALRLARPEAGGSHLTRRASGRSPMPPMGRGSAGLSACPGSLTRKAFAICRRRDGSPRPTMAIACHRCSSAMPRRSCMPSAPALESRCCRASSAMAITP
jgi:DNA-binding transcriptional LysR family regulator